MYQRYVYGDAIQWFTGMYQEYKCMFMVLQVPLLPFGCTVYELHVCIHFVFLYVSRVQKYI